MVQKLTLTEVVEALKTALPPEQPPVEEAPPVNLGYCRRCRRYYEGRADCPNCHDAFTTVIQCRSELQREYGEVLMAVSHLMYDSELGGPLEPQLFERVDDRYAWSAPTNPQFLSNATNSDMRKAIRALRGIAWQHGIRLSVGADHAMGEEVEIMYQGAQWIAWLDTATGTLRPLRKVQVDEQTDRLPEDWHGKEKLTYPCEHCGRVFRSRFALVGHQRSHRKEHGEPEV